MRPRIAALSISLLGLCASMQTWAADLPLRPTLDPGEPTPLDVAPFFVHLGPAGLILDEGAKISAAGTRIPGATIKIAPHVTATLEAGYFFTPNWAVALTVGWPPAPTIEAAGTVAQYGKFGSIVYGPTALTAQYHLRQFGAFQPYLGAGPMYMIVFNEKDAALSRLRVDNAWGAVVQAGADVMLTDRWGVFFDVKKGYLRTEARASLGGLPIKAQVRLDPLVLSGGATYRF